MPAVFIGHGSPMNAIEDNPFRREWHALGERLPRPRAVLCVSAHWETRGARLTGAGHPSTIHDFHGFPKALFDVRYPAPGDPKLARHVVELLGGQKHAQVDATRGLDHGAWSVLRLMYLRADVPVVQLGIDTAQSGEYHYEFAKKLAPLRDEGVLVLGSGNIVHNLGLWDSRNPHPLDWAQRFDASVKRRIRAREHIELVDWQRMGEDARLSIPTPEHYLPLLYLLALQRDGDHVGFFNENVSSAISMTSVVLDPGTANPGRAP
jgi:4,5-DOPA dioxygenase extradiol